MTFAARLVTTLAAPLDLAAADAPAPQIGPEARLVVQRGDAEVVAYDLDECAAGGEAAKVRFPAPWPRRFGTVTVSPRLDLAVFAGVHALRAVDTVGVVRWEVRHGCWDGSCRELHTSFDAYPESHGHLYADSGSAAVAADGKLVWAHIRGPLASDADPDPAALDEWLVLDAADGKVLARVDAQTAAAGSDHVPHPDPGQMGLSVGEGQDGVPLLWGRWDGRTLTVDRLGGDDWVLLAVSPSGDRFLTVTHYQETLAVHRAADGSVLAGADAATAVPRHPEMPPDSDEEEPYWDYYAGFLDEDTVIAATAGSDEEFGAERHWLLDAARMGVAGQIDYPFPISGWPTALGDGTWLTRSEAGDALHLWTR
ncbi:hypothetical protein ACH4S9_03210 [Streptomyces sp. NPDC021225]|uniref:hypothetical protein n=1 Tax=Streptomyces sp. NPDC021225 TaxID=3365121 RepID=UPI003799561A